MLGVTRLQPPTPDQPHYRPMSQFKPLPPIQELQQAFDYDPATGIFRNKYRRARRAKQNEVTGVRKFKKTGQAHKIELTHRSRRLGAHRVAWYLMTGYDPMARDVDHKDRNPFNNTFSNLRLATQRQNQSNRVNKGCYPLANGRFRARIHIDGKMVDIGYYDTAAEATAAYRSKHIEVHGSFSPYFQ